MAPIYLYRRVPLWADITLAENAEAERARFAQASRLAAAQLGALAEQAKKTLGGENARVFEIHQMMLDDPDYLDAVHAIIADERACAEYAVSEAARRFSAMFAKMENEYMRARAADVLDISRRVLQNLAGAAEPELPAGGPVILVSDDFAPSETARFDRAVVKGLVASGGAVNSHAAIFARTAGIPAVIGCGALDALCGGEAAILDGDAGALYVSPTPEETARYTALLQHAAAEAGAREAYRGRPTATVDGRSVKLFANIGSVADADAALANDAEGVGLFRSEFLYLAQNDYPDEETQFAAYRAVAEKMAGRRVVIRTLDIGADKDAPYFNLPPAANPALGLRAVRLCLQRPALFKTQLRAILRASAHGDVAALLPMVTTVDEVRRARALLEEAKRELAGEAILFAQGIPLGVMIETPAAAVISGLLAQEADFFSIGTNDLAQYTLAADRMDETVAAWYDERHPAVLCLVEKTVKNAHAHGIPAAICGELAADETLAGYFIELGVDELSVAPGKILGLRRHIGTL